MTDYQDWEQQPHYPPQGHGQQYQPDQPWQPQQYDPRHHQQRMGQPPREAYASPPAQSGVPRRERSHIPVYAAIAAVALVAGGAAGWVVRGPGTAPTPGPAASSAAAAGTPDTAAAAQSAAQRFFTFYSAGQWDDAWQYLTAAEKREAPESVYAAVHQGCPSAAAGLAYAIKNVTLAGQTAVITYTVSGATGALVGNATMPATWTPSGWGVEPSGMSIYTHGSVSADIAAAKAAGDCAS
jgi:hypothetical protein